MNGTTKSILVLLVMISLVCMGFAGYAHSLADEMADRKASTAFTVFGMTLLVIGFANLWIIIMLILFPNQTPARPEPDIPLSSEVDSPRLSPEANAARKLQERRRQVMLEFDGIIQTICDERLDWDYAASATTILVQSLGPDELEGHLNFLQVSVWDRVEVTYSVFGQNKQTVSLGLNDDENIKKTQQDVRVLLSGK